MVQLKIHLEKMDFQIGTSIIFTNNQFRKFQSGLRMFSYAEVFSKWKR